MTQSYSSGPATSAPESTGQAVREQAANLGQGTAQAGGRVAQSAVEQGREVVRETGTQARNLVNEASGELNHQASMQQKRAAEGLRALGSELRSMAGRSEQQGLASDLVNQAAGRAHQVADWLEHREPGQVLDEVREFARRRPGVFLAGAIAAGVLVGRLTRGLTATAGSTMPGTTVPGTTVPGTTMTGTPPLYETPYPGTPAVGVAEVPPEERL